MVCCKAPFQIDGLDWEAPISSLTDLISGLGNERWCRLKLSYNYMVGVWSEWMNEWMNEWINEWMNVWMNKGMNARQRNLERGIICKEAWINPRLHLPTAPWAEMTLIVSCVASKIPQCLPTQSCTACTPNHTFFTVFFSLWFAAAFINYDSGRWFTLPLLTYFACKSVCLSVSLS